MELILILFFPIVQETLHLSTSLLDYQLFFQRILFYLFNRLVMKFINLTQYHYVLITNWIAAQTTAITIVQVSLLSIHSILTILSRLAKCCSLVAYLVSAEEMNSLRVVFISIISSFIWFISVINTSFDFHGLILSSCYYVSTNSKSKQYRGNKVGFVRSDISFSKAVRNYRSKCGSNWSLRNFKEKFFHYAKS